MWLLPRMAVSGIRWQAERAEVHSMTHLPLAVWLLMLFRKPRLLWMIRRSHLPLAQKWKPFSREWGLIPEPEFRILPEKKWQCPVAKLLPLVPSLYRVQKGSCLMVCPLPELSRCSRVCLSFHRMLFLEKHSQMLPEKHSPSALALWVAKGFPVRQLRKMVQICPCPCLF